MAGPRPRRILCFASKALLCVLCQLNTPGLYCSLRNTCVNIPRVPVQKVNGGKTGSLDVGNENQRWGQSQEGSALEPVSHGDLLKCLPTAQLLLLKLVELVVSVPCTSSLYRFSEEILLPEPPPTANPNKTHNYKLSATWRPETHAWRVRALLIE